jgi:hypothetical protein
MGKDLIFGKTKRSWSRGGAAACLGNSPIVEGLAQPDPLTAEQKEDIRTYLRHLPPADSGVESDNQKFVQVLLDKYGPSQKLARSGDKAGLAKWNELVEWTNKLQKEALENTPSSLIMLRNISRSGLFSPRFRVAT